MKTKLSTIELKVKDYATNEIGSFSYHGEVVIIDKDLGRYDFRFYETDAGTLSVSIDTSKDVIRVVELNDNVNLNMGIKAGEYHPCIYHFDPTNRLLLETRGIETKFEGRRIILEYDLFDRNDEKHKNPITRNKVTIEFEGVEAC
jgi:hypothetical protein